MIRLHCTKKLSAKLPLSENGRLPNRRPNHYAANDAGPDNPLSGDFMMTNSFSPEPVQFNLQKNRIFRACEAEFARLIEKLGVECF